MNNASHADTASNAFLLDGQAAAYYLDDTDTWNTSAEIALVKVNNASWADGSASVNCAGVSGAASDLCTITDTTGGNSTQEIFSVVNNGSFAPAGYGDVWNKTYADTLYADISVVDTTVANCSVVGSCAAITYDSELSYTVDTNETVRVGVLEGRTDSVNASVIANNLSVTSALSAQDECSEISGCVVGAITSYTDTWNTTSDIQAVPVGGEASGTVGNMVLSNTALDDQYVQLGTRLGNTTEEIFGVVDNGTFTKIALPTSCSDGEIAEYNASSGEWDCGVDNSAASGMASFYIATQDTSGTEEITDAETVTYNGDKYTLLTRVTDTVTVGINETVLNTTISDLGISADTCSSGEVLTHFLTSSSSFWNVSTDANDAVEYATGSVTLTGINYCDNTGRYCAWRFSNVSVPQGASITSANITAHNGHGEQLVNGTWFLSLEDDASPLGSNNNNISARTFTSGTKKATSYYDPASWLWSPDISNEVEEVTNRSGWASGNAMLVVYNDTKPNGNF